MTQQSTPHDAIPYYWKSLDWDKFMRDYPPPPYYMHSNGRLSADALWSLQNERFLERMKDAWKTPFYYKRWRAVGLEPGDIRSLDDIERIPTYNTDDLKAAYEEQPPFGTHHPIDHSDFAHIPIKIQTSGGSTGLPRITLFDPIAIEVQAVQTARAFYAQGARPGDVVQITFTCSLANAGWCAYQGVHHWLGGVALTTGAGIVTPTEKQIEYAKAWGTSSWFSRGEYLARVVEIAKRTNFDLRDLKTKRLHSTLGPDLDGTLRRQLEEAWGCPVFDIYGTHEIGMVAFDCEVADRKHISEDTVYLQSADVTTGEPIPYGTEGNIIATALHRSIPPIIRFNMRDRLILYDRETCACGMCTRKLSTFIGRSDEMVKIRGTAVYPSACQRAVAEDPRTTGQYLCIARSVGTGLNRREEMTVRVERRSTDIDAARLQEDLASVFQKDLGVRVEVEIVEVDALIEYTGLGSQNKVRRLLDFRSAI